jgi:hypothetical protein
MTGRCDGCGKTGSACKVRTHILECAAWQALYAQDPAQARDPEAAYLAWTAEGERTEARAERKAVLAGLEVDKRAVADARWATPADILED